MAIERLNAVRLQVIADVEQAYYRVYLTDRSIELTRTHRVSLENLEQVVATQYRVSRAEQHDLLRVQTEVAKLRGLNPTKTIAGALRTYVATGQLPPLNGVRKSGTGLKADPARVQALRQQGLSNREVATALGISTRTVIRLANRASG